MDIFNIDWKKFGTVAIAAGAGAGVLYLSALAPKKMKLPVYLVGGSMIAYAGYEGYKIYKGVSSGDDYSFPIEDFPTQDIQDILDEESGKPAFDVFYIDVFPNMKADRGIFSNAFNFKVGLNNNSSVAGIFHLVSLITNIESGDILINDEVISISANSSNIYETSVTAPRYKVGWGCKFNIQTFIWNRTWTKGCSLETPPCISFGSTNAIPICLS